MGWSPARKKCLINLFTLFLLNVSVESLIDQICVSIGWENIAKEHSLLTSNNEVNPNFCQVQWSQNVSFETGSFFKPYVVLKDSYRPSGSSIGALKYHIRVMHPKALSMYLPDNPMCIKPYDDTTELTLKVFTVKQNGHTLKGWLSFHLELDSKKDVMWMYIQVSDENANAIGEFVTEDGANCPSISGTREKHPNVKQFIPCSAAGLQEPKVSQAMVYSLHHFITDGENPELFLNMKQNFNMSDILTFWEDDYSKSRLSYRLTWRLNEYYCNRHAKFRLVVYYMRESDVSYGCNNQPCYRPGPAVFVYKHGHTIFKRYFWMYPAWFGTADILERNADQTYKPLDCSHQVFDGDGKVLHSPEDFWITKTAPNTKAEDNIIPEEEKPGLNQTTLYKSCRTYVSRLDEHAKDVENQPSFGGRCNEIAGKKYKPGMFNEKKPMPKSSVKVPHACDKNPKATYPPKMENYAEYVKKLKQARRSACDLNCGNIDPTKFENGKTNTKIKFGIREKIVWRSRIFHGIVGNYLTMFVIPLSNFMVRYMKESYLSVNAYGMKVWYFFHIFASLLSFNMFLSLFLSLKRTINNYGYSWSSAGQFHVTFGWSTIVLFAINGIVGPIRPTNKSWRKVVMISHAILGFTQYVMTLILVINSTIIPGSPSGSICYNKLNESMSGYEATSQHKVTAAVNWWIGFDVCFHVLLTWLQIKADKGWAVRRCIYFPIVPVIHGHDKKEFKFHRYRKLCLIIYVFLQFCFTTAITIYIATNSWENCDLGPMTCTHENEARESIFPENRCGVVAHIRALRDARKKT